MKVCEMNAVSCDASIDDARHAGTVSGGDLGSIHGALHNVLSSWRDTALSPHSAFVLLTGALG